MSDPFRAKGPKSNSYTELEQLLEQYYQAVQKKRSSGISRFRYCLRKHVLLKGVSAEDFDDSSQKNNNQGKSNRRLIQNNDREHTRNQSKLFARIGHDLPLIRKVEDTLRGKVWKCLLGVDKLDTAKYHQLINKHKSKDYYKIRGDTKRTFLTSVAYKSRVSEERLVRVLNCYAHRNPSKPYVQGMDALAGQLLHVMPELDAFHTFIVIIEQHMPTYWTSDKNNKKNSLVGAWGGAIFAHKFLEILDPEIFKHLANIHPYTYLYPVIQSCQCICGNIMEVEKLWDFLVAFGLYLNPILAIAQIINAKNEILRTKSSDLAGAAGILGQRKWMGHKVDSKAILTTTMKLITEIKSKSKNNNLKTLWNDLVKHTVDKDIALKYKSKGTNWAPNHHSSPQLLKTSNNGNNMVKSKSSNGKFMNFSIKKQQDYLSDDD